MLAVPQVGTPAGPGRRLPTHGELRAALTAVQLAPGGELTSNVYPSSTDPGELDVLYVTDQVGSVALTPDTAAGGKAFRCVDGPAQLRTRPVTARPADTRREERWHR